MYHQTSYSDQDLVTLAQQGDTQACNQLLLRYNHKIQKIIYSQIQDRDFVCDLAQEVLIKVFRYLDSFKEKSQFSTWLYRITQNTIKNHYRQDNVRIDLEAEYIDHLYSAAQLSPEYLLIKIEFGKQFDSAVSKLSDELRTCYAMCVFDGQSYEDIAKKMDCPIGTVRSRIFRARKLVLESLGQNC